MSSFVSVLSREFGMDSGRVNPEAAGLEIDRFDSWQLAPSSTSGYTPVPSSSGYIPITSSGNYIPVPSSGNHIPHASCGLGPRRAVAPGIIGA